MRIPFPHLPSNSLTLSSRLGLVAVLLGVGACSNFGRSPVFTGSTNQRQIVTGQAATPLGNAYAGQQSAYSSAEVRGSDLPPPTGSPAAPAYASQQTPQPYTPPGTASATAFPQPTQVAAVAPRQLGVPPTTLNQQAASIQGPSGGGAAVHTVQPGDTAWSISRRYGISVDQLAAANGGSTNVRLGSRIAIPGANGPQAGVQLASLNPQAAPPAPQPAPTPAVPAAAAQAPATPLAEAHAQQQEIALAPQTGAAGAMAPAAAAPEPQAQPAASGFRWPVRGRIISGFGKKPNGERNDGINLAVPEGTAVKAAEDGTVIYAGNELKSYGNLVLVRHSNGWVSAYAHNSELKVKRGDDVRRGQVIAMSGMSGGVTTPQVHFELRKDASPVDPLKHLTEA
jgi:murein DD-endopeptidase MepM/ murein hydrolase activator NlpD